MASDCLEDMLSDDQKPDFLKQLLDFNKKFSY